MARRYECPGDWREYGRFKLTGIKILVKFVSRQYKNTAEMTEITRTGHCGTSCQ